MQFVLLVTMFTLVFVIGWLFSSLFSLRSLAEKVGLSWLFGMQLITYCMILSHGFFNLSLNATTLFIQLFFLTALLLGIGYSAGKIKYKKIILKKCYEYLLNTIPHDQMARTITLMLLVFFGLSLISNIYWPLYDWDALALYDFRSKVIVATASMADGAKLGYFYHYPPFTSLLHAYVYFFDFTESKVWYTIIYAAFCTTFYGIIRKNASQLTALLSTLLLVSNVLIFGHSLIAYTNLSYTVYIVLGLMYIVEWYKSGNSTDVLLGSILVGCSTLVRTTEPFWLTAIAVMIIAFIKNFKWNRIPLFIIAILIVQYLKYPWMEYAAMQTQQAVGNPIRTFSSITFDPSLSLFMKRVKDVALFLYSYVFYPQIKYYFLIGVALAYSLYVREKSMIGPFLLFSSVIGTIILGTFLFSYLFIEWQSIPDSASRMAMIVIPLHFYLIGSSSLLKNIVKEYFEKSKA